MHTKVLYRRVDMIVCFTLLGKNCNNAIILLQSKTVYALSTGLHVSRYDLCIAVL